MRRVSLLAVAALVLAALPAGAAPGGPDVRGLSAAALGFVISILAVAPLTALELLVAALAPAPVAAAREVVLSRRPRCLLAGLLTVIAVLVLVGVFSRLGGGGGLLAVLLVAALVVGILLGLPAVASLVGQGVLGLSGRAPTPLAAMAWGLALVFVGGIAPVLGWVLFLYLCLVGLGGVVLSLRRRSPLADLDEDTGGIPPEGDLPPA